ncbi:dsDNA nuclease domain-containing protein [Paenibacillus tyrfis]|uniref:dsDNA nuclease domain-containing protein n=1 Tax=Paenibacillus tyrfis TaxID=1501230 RepID=UPI0020A0BAA0|nr:dsDNA nuclease domain-containing protein [Paenibacillus tyrfis]MCP1307682.1 DUF4297 domain-containing protein [Paenibacillus tyrfis]
MRIMQALSEPVEAAPEINSVVARVKTDQTALLKEILLAVEPEEIGGRTALAGFFYQFLVTIEYIIEVMEGKWDFVSVELHEDIIVGKDNVIRFVQVKTSSETDLRVSKTGIYNRSPYEKDGNIHRLPDSWVDKLLLKARYFPQDQGFNTQFELITSFVVTPSRDVDVSTHCKNYNFNNRIPINDHLLGRLSSQMYDKKNQSSFDYPAVCGEEISSLLSRFNICKKIDLLDSYDFVSLLLYRLSEKLEPGIRVSVEDLQWLIGALMEKCQAIGDNMVLYIDRTEVEGIRQQLHDRAMKTVGESVRRHSSIEVVDRVFDQLLHEIRSVNLYEDLEREVHAYKAHLIEWVSAGGTIRNLLNRYLDGRKYSNKYREITEHDQITKLLELFNSALLLILINEEMLRISLKHQSLLVKEMGTQLLSFLSLNRGETLDIAVDKVRSIFTDPESSVDILLHPPSTVLLQGRFTGHNGPSRSVTICEEKPELSELPQDDSLVNLKIVLNFLPGGKLLEQYDNIYVFNTMEELKTHLKDLWRQLKEAPDGSL